ncbi:hypothetical protein F4780DRAFT_786221 [Xylariomycetidae sp. FL0641]|nr:hypothetical protein F4780DRAFT_786221 [Xylariomycetidae sp. FL0641]
MVRLSILRKNVTHHAPTAEVPHHVIEVTSAETGCKLTFHATKPLPDPLTTHPKWPRGVVAVVPEDYVQVAHLPGPEGGAAVGPGVPRCCQCAAFARGGAGPLFAQWRRVDEALRHRYRTDAALAFPDQDHHAVAEALAHAALVGSIATGKRFPRVYGNVAAELGVTLEAGMGGWEERGGEYDDADE